MSLIPKIFKAYDIRGLAPQEIDADGAYRIGQAVVKFTQAKTVVVGHDMRTTSPEIFDGLSRGICSMGADAVDIGMVTTPMMYFAAGNYDRFDAGVIVTASHNPAEYNGMKLCFGDVLPIGGDTGIYDIRDLAMAGPYEPVGEPGQVSTLDIRSDYLERLFRDVDVSKLSGLKLAIDIGNGMEGTIIDDILARIPGLQTEIMYKEPDGRFPNHEANPLKVETLVDLQKKVLEMGADLGVAFDGDGDRIGLTDEKGQVLRGDILTALLAPVVLRSAPGAAVLYGVPESMAVPEEIEKADGRPVICPVGHGLIKPQMRREDAVFAGELSGHFFFRDFYGAESSDLVLLLVMKLLVESGRPLSELVAPLMRYHHSGEINSKVEDKDAVLAKLEEKYGPLATNVIRIDGVRMEFFDPTDPAGDWWFGVRASNTEPLLRLNLEAKDQAKMERLRDELLAIIRG
ncbi:MAG: phosphomannomutase/phosphoglucomutase [bacterium]